MRSTSASTVCWTMVGRLSSSHCCSSGGRLRFGLGLRGGGGRRLGGRGLLAFGGGRVVFGDDAPDGGENFLHGRFLGRRFRHWGRPLERENESVWPQTRPFSAEGERLQ